VLENSIKRSKKNETILRDLLLIELFIYRVPNKSIRILDKIIKTKSPILTKPIILKGYGIIDINVSHSALIEKSIELLVKIRYIETEKVFNILLRLVIYKDSKIQSLALQAIRDITNYDIFVIEKIGFKPQDFLIREINNWNNNKIKKYFYLIIDVCERLLSPSFQGTSQKDSDTIVWHNGALPISNELKEIRQKTINLLFKMYSNTDDVTHKLKVINTLEDAMRNPSMGKYGDDMVQMIDENTSDIIDFYSAIVPNSDNEIIKNIEEQLYWVNQKFVKQKSNVSELQKIIDEKEEYQIYRVMVGYDFRYSGSKEIEDVEKERLKIIQDYVRKINKDNLSDWKKIVEVQILKNYEKLSELVGYNYFRIFLEQFGAEKPKLAYEFLTQSEDILKPFLGNILQGIWQGNKILYKQILEKWKNEVINLDICAGMYAYTKKINAEDLEDIYKKAKKNPNVFSNILWSISNNEIKNDKLNKLFLNCIEALSKNNNYYWLQYPWYKDKSILKKLSTKDLERMLNILKNKPFIDYDTETLLLPVLEKDPKMFFNFLFERVKIQIEKKEKQERYDAIPMNFHQLNKLLNNNIEASFQELLSWFKKEHYLFKWEASRLLAENYSLQNEKFIGMLIKYIKSNDLVKAKAIIRIFNDFRGNQKIFDLAKIFICYWHEDDKLMIDLQSSLMATDVVTGEYGFVEAYKKKRDLIREWKKDNDPNIKKFALEFDEYLIKQTSYEKKRADDDIALRKRAFE
jgi:hypothetical protein